MDQFTCEFLLSILYSVATCSCLVSSICGAVAWVHWEKTMDKCPYSEWLRKHDNCGCILYGQSFETEFRGGGIPYCHYMTFAPVPILLITVILAGYHTIRACINQKGKSPHQEVTVNRRDGEIMVVADAQSRQYGGHRKLWLLMAGTCLVFSLYMLVHASIVTDGYYKTCTQYRNQLVKDFSAFGNQQAAIHGRLSCSAIYDFMDYLFPDYNDNVRGRFINTTVTLSITMITSWFACVSFFAAAILNFKIAQINRI